MTVNPWRAFILILLLAAVLGYAYFHRDALPAALAKFSKSDSQLTQTMEAALPQEQPAWRTLMREDGFLVQMPGEPKEMQAPAYGEDGGAKPVRMIASTLQSKATFAVSWQEDPPVAHAANGQFEATLTMARDGMLSRVHATLDGEVRLSIGGCPGRDIAAHNAEGGVLNARIIYAGNRLYMLLAAYPSAAARRDADVNRFFNTFSLIAAGATGRTAGSAGQ